ncbi:hypothetical protein, partial [Hymenobacter coccineus]|uniref:hypothetical protein n=1 Tax=Hymenobacter coccineus TaxID=1908235 RepID=UPI001955932B
MHRPAATLVAPRAAGTDFLRLAYRPDVHQLVATEPPGWSRKRGSRPKPGGGRAPRGHLCAAGR